MFVNKYHLALLLTTATVCSAWSPHYTVSKNINKLAPSASEVSVQPQTSLYASSSAVEIKEEKQSEIFNGDDSTVENPRVYGHVTRKKLESFYDLIVVGGGPAGIAGAVKAAQLGRRAIVIDRPKFKDLVLPNGLDILFGGPTGLFSKALRDAAKNTNVAAMRAQYLDDDVIWKQVQNTILKLGSRNSEGQIDMLKRLKIDYLQAEVKLLTEDDPRAVEKQEKFADECENSQTRSVLVQKAPVQGEDGIVKEDQELVLCAERVLVCTGSRAAKLPGIPYDGRRIFNSDSIVNLAFFPHKVIISGAGIIAIEFANIFNKLGSDVTMLIRGDLATSSKKLGMDPDVADELVRLLLASGVNIIENATVEQFENVPSTAISDEKVTLRLSDGSKVDTDIFLGAVGRSGNADDPFTGLEAAGIEYDKRGHATISDKATLALSARGVSGAGDILGAPALASTSMAQAASAVDHMFNSNAEKIEHDFTADMSIGIWTIPEVGYFGMTEAEATNKGIKVVEGVARFNQCLRGRVFAPDGLLKIVARSDTGEIVGVHIIGSDAAEMVHYGMALVKAKNTIFDIMTTTFTAVTFHELFKEAALDANYKLDFGLEWQQIFADLSAFCGVNDDGTKTEGMTVEKTKALFDTIDEDGSGELDAEELRDLFKSLGRPVYKRTISNLMRLADTDKSGTLDWEEFKAIWAKIDC